MRSSIVQAIQHIKQANEFMSDFIRQAPNTRGSIIFGGYSNKLQWILRDILTYPHFPDEVRQGIKHEIESDAFAVEAIHDKIPLLNPEQREMLEGLVEDMLAGKTITISIKNHVIEPSEIIVTEQDVINGFDDGRKWNMSWNGKSYFEDLFKNPNTLGR